MPSQYSIQVRDQDGITIISLLGEQTFEAGMPEFRDKMRAKLDAKQHRFVIDFGGHEGTSRIDSSFVGELFYFHKEATNRTGGRFLLAGINAEVSKTFQLTGDLFDRFQTFQTAEEAWVAIRDE